MADVVVTVPKGKWELSQFYARYRDPERAKELRALTQVVRERARRSGVSEAMLLRELRRAFVAAGRRV